MGRHLSLESVAVAGLLLNAFVWGVSWWPLRHLHALGVHPLWATALVYALTVAVIVARWPHAPGQLLRMPVLWVLALGAGTTNAAFNWAVSIGDVVRVVLLFYLMPLWAVLLARLLLHERLTRLALLRMLLALAGAVIVLKPEGRPWAEANPFASMGLPEVLGIVGGFAFALNNVMLKREAARPAEARAFAMFVGGVLVAGGLALLIGAAGGVPRPPAPTAAWLLPAVGLAFAFLAANLALQYGAARLRANVTAVVMLTEIVFATVSAVLLGDQLLTPAMLAGGALILAAAALSAWEPAPAH
ncbi:MAG TPA: DMT family transporter [Methylibium sp.]|uniref:DMT family transporter n=1 Tax=Methylibium sp. TaxID=2067992 RepID=UPI002DB61374|nr:DMT family transporter [Methylibium sp.]HEU4460492.1 DMT family transporter [Methylibium sp.]